MWRPRYSFILVLLITMELTRHKSISNPRFRFWRKTFSSTLLHSCLGDCLPSKIRCCTQDEALVTHLTRVEIKALLDAPDPRTPSGTRDRAMLHLAFAAGLRVSELIGLKSDQVDQRNWGDIRVMGKGRRERVLPLWKETATAIRAWLSIRPKTSAPELFLNGVGAVLELEPNGAENDKGERLVTSENRLDGAIDSAKIRQKVRDVFDL